MPALQPSVTPETVELLAFRCRGRVYAISLPGTWSELVAILQARGIDLVGATQVYVTSKGRFLTYREGRQQLGIHS